MPFFFKQIFNCKAIALLILFAFIFSLQNAAQNAGTIRGLVNENNAPIEFANAIIFSAKDSIKIIKATTTDSLGKFMFNELPFGNYVLKIQMMGYSPL